MSREIVVTMVGTVHFFYDRFIKFDLNGEPCETCHLSVCPSFAAPLLYLDVNALNRRDELDSMVFPSETVLVLGEKEL